MVSDRPAFRLQVVVIEQLGIAERARTPAVAAGPLGRGPIVRTALLHRLCATAEIPYVTIVAPAGYGKTTLLVQWAERDPRRTEWVALGPEDDEPDVVASLVGPAVAGRGRLVVVDDVQIVRRASSRATLRRLLDRVPPGTTVALAGRSEPRLPLARLRAQGLLLEIGAADLALSPREAQSLLRHAGVLLPEHGVAELEERTEGWPAALHLAALSLRAGGTAASFGGDDRFVADYLAAEHLSELSPRDRRFVTRTSVLERLSADACDALLGRADSVRTLDSLDRKSFVVPLDRRRRRYRYHRLVRDFLRWELERSDPDAARVLNLRAADWSERNGDTEQALLHAVAADDVERAAALAARAAFRALAQGRLDDIERWHDTLGDDAVEPHAELCIASSLAQALRGRASASHRAADAAARVMDGNDPRLRLLHSLRCRDGLEQMLDDAAAAWPALGPGDPWWAVARLARGVALRLTGDEARAERDLCDATELGRAVDAVDVLVAALCVRSLAAADAERTGEADDLADEAATAWETGAGDPSAVHALLHAVSARTALRRGDRDAAAAATERADELRPFLTYALPWLAVMTMLELAHVRIALNEADGARELLRGVDEILRVRPRLGTLVRRAVDLRRRAHALSEPEGRWASSLTSAEARLLPLLATHLSFREIGEHLFVSRNTVKTQAISVYRKFGVSSRSDAVARALDLGLIDDGR